MLQRMDFRHAGHHVTLLLEFPTDEQLRKARKGSTVAENARAHTALRSHGIAVHAAFMLLP